MLWKGGGGQDGNKRDRGKRRRLADELGFVFARADTRARASVCHQNEAGSYAKQTIRGVPPGAKQPIMAAPVRATNQQEAE